MGPQRGLILCIWAATILVIPFSVLILMGFFHNFCQFTVAECSNQRKKVSKKWMNNFPVGNQQALNNPFGGSKYLAQHSAYNYVPLLIRDSFSSEKIADNSVGSEAAGS
jgi:hypothetical protein